MQWVTKNNVIFKSGLAVYLNDDNVLPLFGEIQNVILNGDKIFFALIVLYTIGYNSKAQAFEISFGNRKNLQVFSYESLINTNSFSIHYTADGKICYFHSKQMIFVRFDS